MTVQNYGINRFPTFMSSDILETQDKNAPQIITKPIQQVETLVNNTVDTFVPESEDEEKKKSHKTAIRVGSTVLVLSAFVALLNPKFLTKFSNKLKTLSAKAGNKAQVKGDFTGKLYSAGQKFLDGAGKVLNFTNNINTIKDEGFKWLCEKSVILKKPHEFITKWFDKVGRHTVVKSYEKANKEVNILNETLTKYAEKLSPAERKIFDEKMAEIKNVQEYFNVSSVQSRLQNQEKIMANLEKDSIGKMKSYFMGYKKPLSKENLKHDLQYAKDNLGYWAEDAIAAEKAKLNTEGEKVISKIVGGENSQNGAYKEILDLLSSHTKPEEQKVLKDAIEHTAKKIRKAKFNECAEYFDNKRDLILGSAPTDILTALFFLSMSGIAVKRADTKEERISKALTGVFPTVAGLGSSLALTALLFSGVKGKIVSAILSGALSLMGSGLNRAVNPQYHTKKEITNA